MSQTEPRLINSDLLKTLTWPGMEAKGVHSPEGAVLIAAGSKYRPGAAILAARAALRLGVTVHLAAPESLALQIAIALPEIMLIPLLEAANGTLERDGLGLLKELGAGCGAAFISGGLARDEANIRQLREAIEELNLPTVTDYALLETTKRKPKQTTSNGTATGSVLIYSPSTDSTPVKVDMDGLCKQAEERNVTIILMRDEAGVAYVIAPDGTQYKDTNEVCGLKLSGGQDVLAGLVAGLRAQQVEATATAIWGLHLFTHALDGARKDLGDESILASDLPPRLPSVLRYLRRTVAQRSDSQPFGLRRNI